MESVSDNNALDKNVYGKDIIAAAVGVFAFFGALSVLLEATGGVAHSSGYSNNILTTSGGGGGVAYSWASQEFEIQNNTPWWEFWYSVHSNEVAYFNASAYWTSTQVESPSVTMVANAFGNPPGQVVSRNGPYEFTSGTNSNGVQYVIYSSDVQMADTANTAEGPVTSTNTNILVDYEIMGNGNILIKYWVDNTAITNGWTGLEDLATVFAQSGGG